MPIPFQRGAITFCGDPSRLGTQRPTQLSAVFFLDQGESDQVIPLGKAVAAARIMQSAGQVCQRMWRGLEGSVQEKTT